MTGHNEVVLVVYDPAQVTLRAAARGVLGEPRSDAGHAPGQRRRHAVPLRHLHVRRRAGSRRPRRRKAMYERAPRRRRATARSRRRSCRRPTFYYAEDYHQQYLGKNPSGYCGLGGTGVSLSDRRSRAERIARIAHRRRRALIWFTSPGPLRYDRGMAPRIALQRSGARRRVVRSAAAARTRRRPMPAARLEGFESPDLVCPGDPACASDGRRCAPGRRREAERTRRRTSRPTPTRTAIASGRPTSRTPTSTATASSTACGCSAAAAPRIGGETDVEARAIAFVEGDTTVVDRSTSTAIGLLAGDLDQIRNHPTLAGARHRSHHHRRDARARHARHVGLWGPTVDRHRPPAVRARRAVRRRGRRDQGGGRDRAAARA